MGAVGREMRILLVANTLPPADISGVGEQVLQLAAGLQAAGHEVRVLGRGRGGARGPKLLFPLAVLPAFLREWWRFRPQVVQVHESDGALAALAAAVLGAAGRGATLSALLQVSYLEERRAVRPLVADGRVLGRPGFAERRFRWLKAPLQAALGCLTAWLADVVMAPSQATAAELRRDYRIDDVAVLPNVTGGLERRAAESEAVESEGTRGALLFVGRLRIRKGVEVLLEALARPELASRSARLLVAGDGEHRARLERRARDLGLGDRVRFLGRRDAGGVRRLLAGARALVVPSIYEGMPLVVLEAMEAGLPVVASAVSGIPEVVVDGETGWLVPPEDPVALAAALERALADPEESARRGAAGRRRLDARFRPEAAVRTWLEIIGAGHAEEAGESEKGGEKEITG